MAKQLREQGTVADLPLKISKKVYFVRSENGMVADHGWITVDEARRKNAGDRREFGAFQNRYFIDQPSAQNYMTTVQPAATGFEEEPPGVPGGPPPGPGGELGPGLGAPEGPPAEPPPGLEEPPGPPGLGEEPDLAGDLGDILPEEEPGELPPEEIGGEVPPLAEPEEEEEIEFIVPKRIRLRTEAGGTRRPPWERHPKSIENHEETRYCPQCRTEQSFIEDICQHCHTYSAKPQERQGESLHERRPGSFRWMDMVCPACGETWGVELDPVRGELEFDKAEGYCPECGEEGEELPSGPAPGSWDAKRRDIARKARASQESTEEGIIEALISGELSARDAIEMFSETTKLEKCPPLGKAAARARSRKKRGPGERKRAGQ